ncbi:hypothetical protein JVU11DRAFT_10183 [Chiua virens]|nr:hypothetical protein JVU11DRAFT_10183 [Chiua virens]
MPLEVRTPQAPAAGVAGVGVGAMWDGGDIGAVAGRTPRTLQSQPSLWRLREQEVPQVMQQLSIPRLLQTLPPVMQPSQYVNPSRGAAPLVLPAVLPSAQEGGYDVIVP